VMAFGQMRFCLRADEISSLGFVLAFCVSISVGFWQSVFSFGALFRRFLLFCSKKKKTLLSLCEKLVVPEA